MILKSGPTGLCESGFTSAIRSRNNGQRWH